MSEHEDAVVERCTEQLCEHLWGHHWVDKCEADRVRHRDDMRKTVEWALLSLKPGDRLPGGLVVVPEDPWHFLAVCKEMLSPENADKYFGAHPIPVDHAKITATTNDRGQNADDS